MEGLLADKGIDATFEYWGLDVSHDWSWWQEEARQLLPCLLEPNGLLKRKLSARFAIAKAAAEHAAERLRVDKEELLRGKCRGSRRPLQGKVHDRPHRRRGGRGRGFHRRRDEARQGRQGCLGQA